ncbi:MAG: polysaccharide pyruvyl transferase family protein [Quadrisphaera sp.]
MSSQGPGHRRALVVGWSSVVHGEATAGDVLSMRAVEAALRGAGVGVDLAWSPVMAAAPGAGGVELSAADPADYTDLVWACGPLHGRAVTEVAARFSGLRRTAVGVSVVDDDDEVPRAFDLVLARDAPGRPAVRDLAAGPAAALARDLPVVAGTSSSSSSTDPEPTVSSSSPGAPATGVVGVYLAPGQAEYGARRRHEEVTRALGEQLNASPHARLALDTRLDPRGWRDPSTPAEVLAVLRRCDAVVTMRLHGLVLALAAGVPAVAVDPVAGGGKVSAQAAAWGWPALLSAEELLGGGLGPLGDLHAQLAWATGEQGRAAARRAAEEAPTAGREQLQTLVSAVLA